MPIIGVEGPPITDLEKKRAFVTALTDAAELAFGLPRDAYVVLLKENRPDNIAVGGELIADRQAS